MKVYTGKVVSKKMSKTATVEVVSFLAHSVYKKRVKHTRRYPVHDEMDTKVGDRVKFVDCRPVSKTKKWKIIEVVGESQKQKKKGRKK